MLKNIVLSYVKILILSISLKNFTAMGRFNNVSADTIARKLPESNSSFQEMLKIALEFFKNSRELFLVIDDTFMHKKYSKLIEGTDDHFDSKIYRRVRSFKLITFGITDGKHILPLYCDFLFGKFLPEGQIPSKFEIIQKTIIYVQKMFTDKRVIVVADGAFPSIEMLSWCIEKNISAEFRIHNNRKVTFENKHELVKNIQALQPIGKQKSRTIKVIWHKLDLYLTAQKRIDKKGKETIVYQVSTYFAKPSKHVKIYKKRWPIEKMFRTTKQHLGLQECQSTKIETQLNHAAAVFLAYSNVVVQQKKKKFKTPEEALRAAKLKKVFFFELCNSSKESIRSNLSVAC
jgi:hypothetical protein